ncbi:MAG: alpha/beta hydrolase [Litorilinea sp.]
METFVSKDGTQIAYARSGSGPGLLLVHGTSADHTRWPTILPTLEKHFTVYAMDRRGRGGSGDTADYSIEREFEDVAGLVNTIHDATGEPVHLFGHSYGATCAAEAARLTSDIDRLILYEPPPPGDQDLCSPETLAKLQSLLEAGDRDALVSSFLTEVAGLSAAELENARAAPTWQGRRAAAHTIIRETQAEQTLPPFDPARYRTITAPTLLLMGGASLPEFKKTTQQFHAALPNSRLVELPDQKHVAMNTAPNLFLRAIFDFLGVE